MSQNKAKSRYNYKKHKALLLLMSRYPLGTIFTGFISQEVSLGDVCLLNEVIEVQGMLAAEGSDTDERDVFHHTIL